MSFYNDDDLKKIAEFLNFVVEKTKLDCSTKDIFKFYEMYSFMVKFLKRLEDNILEIKEVKEKKK